MIELDHSAVIKATLAGFVLLVGQACAETTPEPTRSAPPQLTPDTNLGVQSVRPAAGSEPGFAVPHPANFESVLSGETLALYRALPPEFQEALQAYAAWGIALDLVPVLVDQKMRQWRSKPAPMSEVLTTIGYQKFQDLAPRLYKQALYLLYFYPYVLATEESPAAQQRALERMVSAMHEGEPSDRYEPLLPRDAAVYEFTDRETNLPLDLHEILTSDILTRYQSLPFEYQQALRDYARTITDTQQIPIAVGHGVLNLPESAGPLKDILSPDAYEKFKGLATPVKVVYVLAWYPEVLKHLRDPDLRKQNLEQLAVAMHEEMYAEQHSIHYCLSNLEGVLLPEAIRRLDSLGPNLQQAFPDSLRFEPFNYDMLLPLSIKQWEVFLLKAPPGLEMPSLEDKLSEEGRQQFRRLSLDHQRVLRNRQYVSPILSRAGGLASHSPKGTLPSNILEFYGRGLPSELSKLLVSQITPWSGGCASAA